MTDHSTPTPAETGTGEIRPVTTVAELKALADPLRLAILDALTGGTSRQLRVLSVKELAAELGEPKTKLYRHVKLLEAAGLIRVAATRLVSGIVEQRYQACQIDLVAGPWSIREPGAADQANAAVAATLDHYRRRFVGYLASLPPGGPPSEGRSLLTTAGRTLSPARAQIIKDKLQEILAELDRPAGPGDDGDGTVQLELLVSYMTIG